MYKILVLLIVLVVAACGDGDGEVGGEKNRPPQLWSDHKFMDIPVSSCRETGRGALRSLGFTRVVLNGNYAYGNYKNNRAAVKCVEVNGGSFVYLMVAGPEKRVVEELRNEIYWKF
ncbi:MAG: hypothetical protein OEZ68_19475 [Gammaproteobacteria bacterium]|nr:hypothetical protein [Gammaproteobacteria bacterium]MDH5802990.1 hypothetical protein [Gammaproteobacteria bacterium]